MKSYQELGIPTMSEYAMAKKEMEGYDESMGDHLRKHIKPLKNHKLVDRIYAVLQDIDEFRNLSMDRQGEICVAIERALKDVFLKVDEWDFENDKVGC
jgi:hypothetical protein